MAKFLRERHITRDSAACPWHCGRTVPIGGAALLVHLNTCHGPGKGRKVKQSEPKS